MRKMFSWSANMGKLGIFQGHFKGRQTKKKEFLLKKKSLKNGVKAF